MEIEELEKRIKPITALPSFVSAVIYGRSGTGKTVLAGTFPKPLLLADVKEQGTDSIRKNEGVFVITINQWMDIEDLYHYLVNGKHEFKTVVIDTITSLQDLCQTYVLSKKGKGPDSPLHQDDWGMVSRLMKGMIILFRDLPMHVVFVAQDRTTEAPEQEEQVFQEVGPRLMPSVASTLTCAVKVVGQTFIKETEKVTKNNKLIRIATYRVRLGPHAYYLTKVRQPKGYIPADIVNPTFEMIFKVVSGEYQQLKPEVQSTLNKQPQQQSPVSTSGIITVVQSAIEVGTDVEDGRKEK